jgi:hypothetical protein
LERKLGRTEEITIGSLDRHKEIWADLEKQDTEAETLAGGV